MKMETLPQGDTSASVATASEESAPVTTETEEVAKLKAEVAAAKSEARHQALARKVDQDEFQFRSVYQADQKAAERIAREKWKLTPSEVLGQLAAAEQAANADTSPTAASVVVPENQIRAFIAAEKERESALAAKTAAVEALGLEGDALEAFEREYASITNGRNVTAGEAKRYVKAAFALLNESDVATVENARKNVSSVVRVGQSSEGPAAPEPEQELDSEVKRMRARREAASYKSWYKNA